MHHHMRFRSHCFKLTLSSIFDCLYFLLPLGEDALPNGLDVTFEVTELRRLTGSYNTMVGNNEGSMVSATMHGVSIYFLRDHTALDPIMVLRWTF